MRRHALRAFVSAATVLALLILGVAVGRVSDIWTLLALCFLMLVGGFLVNYEGPDELRARIAREIPVWKEIVERAGLAKH